MSEPFLAEIRIFAGNFAPRGWALCNGQLMAISQNTALFSLLGTYYGGDGKTTFALPDLEGSAPMHPGQGPGLTPRDLGEIGGSQTVTVLESEIPNHTHGSPQALNQPGDSKVPIGPNGGNYIAGRGLNVFKVPTGNDQVIMSATSLAFSGGTLPHNNMQPYLVMTFIIALQGVYPARG